MEVLWAIPLVILGIGIITVSLNCKKIEKQVISLEQELKALKDKSE
ncbi:MAG: hypothetical protein FWG44_00040 [Oscillospiraceae bacterium]|nr:hypothetical protein [Oscillospiraceae bacterium]